MKIAFSLVAFGMSFVVQAQSIVRFPAAIPEGAARSEDVEAVLSSPASQPSTAKRPAVILVHSGWGWAEEGVTAKYAKALVEAGFITLEPHLFSNGQGIKGGAGVYMPQIFGALRYLASRPDVDARRIAIAGYSYGGQVALVSALSVVSERYGGLRFAAHAPFYPVCWLYEANVTGRRPTPVAVEAWSRWTGAPVRIYAGALDDYDDRDPIACQSFVNSLPQEQQRSFSVRVFPDATHGWDQTRSDRFFEKMACKGKGCYNVNRQNPEATNAGIKDLIDFLSAAMPG